MKPKRPKRIGTRLDFWSDKIKSWKSSNLSQSEYCRKNNLDINLFSKWKRRLSKNNFIKIDSKRLSFSTTEYPFEIMIKGKYTIKLMNHFPEDDLKKIISVIGGEV
jgi:hypothetical protein